jgi:hypothetical protein
MNISMPLFALLSGIVLLAACEEPISGPENSRNIRPQANASANAAEREVYQSLYDMNGSVIVAVCADGTESEPVLMSGKIFERITRTATASGISVYNWDTMPVGLAGVGMVTGAAYRISETIHGTTRYSEIGERGSFKASYRLESKEANMRFRFSYTSHFTVNNNGELAVSRDKGSAVCEI